MRTVFGFFLTAVLGISFLTCGGTRPGTEGKLYIIGTGAGDRDLLTLRAYDVIRKCDAFIGGEDIVKKLASDIGSRPVIFDPFLQLPRFYRKKYPNVSEKESVIAAEALYKKDMALLARLLGEGKAVGLLEPGDPVLYGGWRNWVFPHVNKESIEVISGISSFSAAGALFRDGSLTEGSVVLTEPVSLEKNRLMVKGAAENGDTLVIFMALDRMEKTVRALKRYFPGNTPAHIVYDAGVTGKEKKISTDLQGLERAAKSNSESKLGLVFIGRHLK